MQWRTTDDVRSHIISNGCDSLLNHTYNMEANITIPSELSNNAEAREAGFDVYFAGLEQGVDHAYVTVPREFASAFMDGWELGWRYARAIRRMNK